MGYEAKATDVIADRFGLTDDEAYVFSSSVLEGVQPTGDRYVEMHQLTSRRYFSKVLSKIERKVGVSRHKWGQVMVDVVSAIAEEQDDSDHESDYQVDPITEFDESIESMFAVAFVDGEWRQFEVPVIGLSRGCRTAKIQGSKDHVIPHFRRRFLDIPTYNNASNLGVDLKTAIKKSIAARDRKAQGLIEKLDEAEGEIIVLKQLLNSRLLLDEVMEHVEADSEESNEETDTDADSESEVKSSGGSTAKTVRERFLIQEDSNSQEEDEDASNDADNG